MTAVRRITGTVSLVAIGGAAGATTRHLIGAAAGDAFLVTFAVNVVGSLLLGILVYGGGTIVGHARHVRRILGTGFLASFTTYSTFIADVGIMSPPRAAFYVLGSYAAGFMAIILARRSLPNPEGE